MDTKYIKYLAAFSLKEDLGINGDITTSALVPKSRRSTAVLVSKSSGIISGLDLAKAVFRTLDPDCCFKCSIKDGGRVKSGAVIAEVTGSSRAILTGERTALNFLSYLSGIATTTRQFVDAVKGYKVKILDTRKTTPLLRYAERYAVACGGGVNHRYDLSSMAMIKDNHRLLVKEGRISLNEAVNKIKAQSKVKVELEVDTLQELAEAFLTKADIILLDNMSPSQTRQAVLMRNRLNKKIILESSGGINLSNVVLYAKAGVERVSIGSLTHSRQALDISLELVG